MKEPDRKPPPHAIAPGEVIAFLALAMTLIAVLWIVQRYLLGLGVRAGNGDTSVADALAQVRVVALFAAALVLASAAVLGRLVWKIGKAAIAQRHFPPEGIVSIDLRLHREGAEAEQLGRKLCSAGILIAAIGMIATAIAVAIILRL